MSSPTVERGVQRPSRYVTPEKTHSDASDALFLSGSYGLTADPWQERVLDHWLARRADGRWAATRCGLAVPRQNGKNGALEMRELFGMVALAERFLHTAHEVKTARKAFLRLCGFFENSKAYPELTGLVKEIRKTNGQEAIVLHNGGSVEFIARSKSSGRGFSVDVLVMDEAQELSEEALAALLPTISASRNPQLILTGTPPGPTANGEVFVRTRKHALAGDEVRASWLEWGCKHSDDPDDPASWATSNPSLGIRLNVETITDERSTMDTETFKRERLGVWPSTSARSVIDQAVWADLDNVPEQRPSPIALCVMVSPDLEWTSIALAGLRPDGHRQLQIVESARGSGWLVERLKELVKTWRPVAVALDPAGPEGSLLADLNAAEIDLTLLSGREVQQACGSMLNAISERTVRHSGQPLLNIAVKAAGKQPRGDAFVWRSNDQKTDIAPLKAVTYALHALTVNGAQRSESFVPRRIR